MLIIVKNKTEILGSVNAGDDFALPAPARRPLNEGDVISDVFDVIALVDDGPMPPEGQEVASSSMQVVEGVPTMVYEYRDIPVIPEPEPEPEPEPIDPLTLPITKRQMLGVLADMGIDAEPVIDGAIEAIEDTATRAKYRNDWRYAGGFVRQHPLFNDPDFMALLEMDAAQVDTLWVAAQGYPV